MKKLLSLSITKIAIISAMFFVLALNIYSVTKINDINSNFSNRQNEATWFVFQLVKEYANFLTVSQSTNIDYEKLWLAYDITWSRFDILINSNESSNFIRSANFKPYFTSEFEKFRTLESSIKLVEQGEIPKEPLQKKIEICYQGMVSFINDNFRLQSPVIEDNTQTVNQLVLMNRVSSFVLVMLIILAASILYFDSAYNVKLRTTDHITGFYNRLSLIKFIKDRYSNDSNFDLYFVRIRNLKEINQKYGVEYGDLVVSSAAKSLLTKVPKETVSFRSSGGQFVFFVPKEQTDSNEMKEKFSNVLGDYISAGNLELMIDAAVRHKKDIHPEDMMELITSMQTA